MLPTIRVLRRSDIGQGDIAPISIVITFRSEKKGDPSKRQYISTGVRVSEKQWHEGKVIGKNATVLNAQINAKLKEYEDFYLYGPGKKDEKVNFFDYAAKYLEDNKNKLAPATIISYKGAVEKFRLYTGDINFSAITIETLQQFEDSLYKEELSGNRVNKIFKIIKSIAYHAYNMQDVNISAFKKYKFTAFKQPARSFLTIEQVGEIEKLALKPNYDNIRNYFLIGCKTGLRYSDLSNLKERIIETSGIKRIILNTKKTGDIASIAVNDKLLHLINKVGILPINIECNRVLRKIGEMIGVEGLHFHTSRHTFSCNLLAMGTDVFTLSKLLSHKNVTTTQIYAKVIDKKLDEAVNLL